MGTELEVLPPAGEPHAVDEATPRAWPRWPWAIAALVVVVAGLAFPVRLALARAELDRCQRVWADLLALDASRLTLTNRLNDAAVPSDAPLVQRAVSGLYQEETNRVGALNRLLPAHRSLDHGVGALRSAISGALRLQIDDLRTAAPYVVGIGGPDRSAQTLVQFQRVASLLESQRRRFGETEAPPAPTAVLHAADATLRTLGHYSDLPLGVHLFVTTNFGPRLLDLDRSRDAAAPLGPSAQVLFRAGFVMVADGGQIYRLPPDLSGRRQPLGPGTSIFAAGRPDALWIADLAGLVREVTVDGQLLVAPALPRVTVLGSVTTGLVVNGGGLWILDSSLSFFDRPLETAPFLLTAAAGDTVAWIRRSDPAGIFVHTVSRKSTMTVRVPDGFEATAFGAVDPAGRFLAVYLLDRSTAAFAPAVIDLTTGRLRSLPGTETPFVHLSMAWTATGSRLFFTTNFGGASIATWSPTDAGPTVLRWRGPPALGLAVLP